MGKSLIVLSFVIGAILLIISLMFVGFGNNRFSDDFWFWLISAIVSFCLLFFTGKYLSKESNKKLKTSSKAHILKTIASIMFIIGIVLSILVIIISFRSPDGGLGLFLILPLVFGIFFALGIILLLIHYFINR